MTADTRQQILPPRIEGLKVRNFRSLQNIEFRKLTPITVLLGPNGSGKSTLFDVFAFLAECFESGLRKAWDRRGRARELKTRGANGPVAIEIKYRERHGAPLITYHISVDERKGAPVVAHEWVSWKRRSYGAPFRFLEYKGRHRAMRSAAMRPRRRIGEPQIHVERAGSACGQCPRAVPGLSAGDGAAQIHHGLACILSVGGYGPRPARSRTGRTIERAPADNLANVIRHLAERHPARLEAHIAQRSAAMCRGSRRCCRRCDARRPKLLLQVKDAPFKQPVPARFRLRRHAEDACLSDAIV